MNNTADTQFFILHRAEQANAFIFTLVHVFSVRVVSVTGLWEGLNSFNKNYNLLS
jgi:hypothetical protein